MLKLTLRRLASSFGYEVRRKQPPPPGCNWMADLARLLPPDHAPILFDVGANVGQTSLSLAATFGPRATIHAFEPSHTTFATLSATLASLPQAHAHPLALGDQSGRAQLHHGHNSQLHRLTPIPALATGTTEEIELTTLDAFTNARSMTSLTLLKTDTEGHDAAVLRGATGLLRRGAIRAVIAEVTFEAGNHLHTSFDAVRGLLEPHDFRLHNFYECAHWGLDLKYCNALFLHSPDFPPELAGRSLNSGFSSR